METTNTTMETQINQLIDIAKKCNKIAEMLNMESEKHNTMTNSHGSDNYNLDIIHYSNGEGFWTIEFNMHDSSMHLAFTYHAHATPEFHMTVNLMDYIDEFLKEVRSLYLAYAISVRETLKAKLEQDLQSL